ncbi:MAG: substrate-binding domain-containing protein [Magnetococcus sp. YQC-5]
MFVSFFLLVGLLFSPVHGMAAPPGPGPAFSDPQGVVSKPDSWQKEPIHREEVSQKARVALTLDQHLYTAFLPIIQEYAKMHTLEVAVRQGTCGNSEALLNKKQVDIAGFCCPPALTDRLPGLRFHSVGIVGLAILVHADNPVESLTEQQARDLFSGVIRNWSEVLPEEAKARFSLPVRPVGRLHCPTRPGHWRLILNDREQFSLDMAEVGNVSDMISSVASYRGAVGYEILWNLDRFGKDKPIKAVRINGFASDDTEALVKGVYPFFRVNTLTHWENPESANPEALDLVRHIESQVEQMPVKYHVVPAQRLQQAGWPFLGDELIGLPLHDKKP